MLQRQIRVRRKIRVSSSRPRLSVFRSNKYIYAQVINDEKGVTLASAKGEDPVVVGEAVAKNALKKKVTLVVFDRSKYKYHGKVKALADAARAAGLQF